MFGSEISVNDKLKLRNKFAKKILDKFNKNLNLLVKYDKQILNNDTVQKGGTADMMFIEITDIITELEQSITTITNDNQKLVDSLFSKLEGMGATPDAIIEYKEYPVKLSELKRKLLAIKKAFEDDDLVKTKIEGYLEKISQPPKP